MVCEVTPYDIKTSRVETFKYISSSISLYKRSYYFDMCLFVPGTYYSVEVFSKPLISNYLYILSSCILLGSFARFKLEYPCTLTTDVFPNNNFEPTITTKRAQLSIRTFKNFPFSQIGEGNVYIYEN